MSRNGQGKRNPDTGHYGTVTPLRTFQDAGGQYCREFQQTITVGGQTRWVLWASPDGSQVQISIPAGATQAKDELGAAIPLAGSGLSTTYRLTDSPIYVDF